MSDESDKSDMSDESDGAGYGPAVPLSSSLPRSALPQHAGIRKDARSIGIGRGTKCR